ncbi:MAG: M48 family peptidase [Bryobacteraceae bacterium]
MQDPDGIELVGGIQSALFFETPAEIYTRVFRELKPRTRPPEIRVEFCRFANADSFVKLAGDGLSVRICDIFEGAPAPVTEALAHILLGKLFRKPIPKAYSYRYRMYLCRRDVRRQMQLVKQIRGRKFLSGSEGAHYDLNEVFELLNVNHFDGLMGRPLLGWSRRPSRSLLGHYDPSHNAIVISRIFDDPALPQLALEYVMFHEMLHLRFPVNHVAGRRRVHTREFREAEKTFPRLREAKEILKRL